MTAKQKRFKVSGNNKIGMRLIIPREAYLLGGEAREYTCYYNGDGTLIYRPVRL